MKPPWRKILYEKQKYPDNYCGPEFLRELQNNVTAETYTLNQAIRGSCVLMQQISSLLIYVILFSVVYQNFVSSTVILSGCFTLGLFAYLTDLCFNFQHVSAEKIVRDFKTLALYVGFAYGLSPIFKSLTETISTDTIYAMATMMLSMNVIFADYGVDVFIVSYALSLNAGIFGSVCLLSRLSNADEVFTILTLAVEIFVLWPLFRLKLMKVLPSSDVWITIILAFLVISGLWLLSAVSLCMYIVGHLFISFVCPFWLTKMQHLKKTIHGPWDEAVIEN